MGRIVDTNAEKGKGQSLDECPLFLSPGNVSDSEALKIAGSLVEADECASEGSVDVTMYEEVNEYDELAQRVYLREECKESKSQSRKKSDYSRNCCKVNNTKVLNDPLGLNWRGKRINKAVSRVKPSRKDGGPAVGEAQVLLSMLEIKKVDNLDSSVSQS